MHLDMWTSLTWLHLNWSSNENINISSSLRNTQWICIFKKCISALSCTVYTYILSFCCSCYLVCPWQGPDCARNCHIPQTYVPLIFWSGTEELEVHPQAHHLFQCLLHQVRTDICFTHVCTTDVFLLLPMYIWYTNTISPMQWLEILYSIQHSHLWY